MRVDVVEEDFLGSEAKSNGETSAEGFDEAGVGVVDPELGEVGNEPTFAASPFEGWGEGVRLVGGFHLY